MKKCNTCKIQKSVDSFGKYSRSKDGLRGRCKSCRKSLEPTRTYYNKLYYENNKEKIKSNAKKWRQDNKDLIKSRWKSGRYAETKRLSDKNYRERNTNYLKERNHQYFLKNKKRILKINKKNYKKWISSKRGKKLHAANEAKRRAAKLNATPVWSDLNKIRKIYENCPKGYHVDHIIPLQGKNVRGLHVEYNLQYLPASENLSKSNKLKEL